MKGIILIGYLLFIACLNYLYVQGAYFYVKEGVEKCFVENVTKNVIIVSLYDNYGTKELKCLINVKDKNGLVLYTHDVSQMSKGKISYMAKSSGLHYICILCPSNNWFKDTSIKWNFSIEVGGADIDINNTAKKSELSATLNTLQNLKKKFNSMKSHHAHQKVIADNMHEHNKNVHKSMIYCYIIEIIILIIITGYSIMHLKNYFKANKLM
ncbi:transmembrane emp24 domain-containing protein, putative [Plasmodium berghei]|uniref:Transmembrane emp24 domain-containing protein, putative n=2 Tax=Plasmodium berghei TaxID=5821 RepID=A0A509AQX8_PLABA|nr:transmembrane emp24 domain-containing protein, putative [Plasmodium berghei ANKA]CXI83371.1 transmembrane emp24 domain-containing protein, putative [Plasmodium berghei]SCM25703.1 transmembrane emp24 domain-containing protein, putative [Plasmodium berghei]SCN27459.1 transmembrane emp24 domain-containing protein, putative [Plasmodium berghei]SCO62165.1 transmembrane emp24 domain-containing protein, putative [Plasmodium berghei]SCO63886.1 transmembrane emp24 domain-containing protein, putative|eukprot:XP_034423091.1 transmembrane emp24 domain-containing protein, putative [Plasmodium berghei ANKA]